MVYNNKIIYVIYYILKRFRNMLFDISVCFGSRISVRCSAPGAPIRFVRTAGDLACPSHNQSTFTLIARPLNQLVRRRPFPAGL